MTLLRHHLLATACLVGAIHAQGPANEQEAQNWAGPGSAVATGASDPDATLPIPAAVRRVGGLINDVNINTSDGTLRAYAPRYETVFGDRDVDFIPVTGIQTDRKISLTLELESIRRASGEPMLAQQGEQVVDGLQVRYRRPTYDEIYDVGTDAMEQSFEFRTLPQGSGDLIVRSRVTTEMVANTSEWTQAGLKLHLEGARGHAWIGAVTGIDANGRRATGALRMVDGFLELSLPGQFVDEAALPLILDPFIGAAFEGSASGTSFDQRTPDVAYDASADVYFIVWSREVGSNFQIRGRAVDSTGTSVFGLIGVVSSTAVSKFRPTCANIAIEDAFIVTWYENSDIRASAVTTAGIVVDSAGIDVRATADLEVTPDVGGEQTNVDNDAVCVWWNLTTGEIEAAQIQLVQSSGIFNVLGFTNITTLSGGGGTGDSAPSISKSGGSTGNFLITYQRVLGDSEIRGMVVDRNIAAIDSFIPVTSNSDSDLNAQCDGDGRNWVIAWQRLESSSGSLADIWAIPVHLNNAGAAYTGTEVAVENGVGDDEQNPTVAWLGESVLIGFADQFSTGSNIFDGTVVSVDPFTCERISSELLVETSALDQDFIAIAAAASGGSTDDTALLVWDEEDNSTFDSTIRARFWEAVEGTVTQEGGGCGTGGEAFATSVDDGNSLFTHRLRFATTGAACALIFSFDRIDAVCGTCTLVPNPITGYGFGTTTDVQGNAEIAMAIPANSALVGVTFYDQWIVAGGGSGCTVLGADFSSAISATIE